MHATLARALEDLDLGSPQTFRNLTVVPLVTRPRTDAPAPPIDDPTYLTLDQAIAHEAIVIQEMSDLASVPELQAINRGDKPVLLVDGDGLMGAKQDDWLVSCAASPERPSIHRRLLGFSKEKKCQ